MKNSSAWHFAKLLAVWTVCGAALAAGPVPKVVRVEPLVKWGGVEPNTQLDSAQAVFALVQPRYDRSFVQCGGWNAGCYKYTALEMIPVSTTTINGVPDSGYKWSLMSERKVGDRIEVSYGESAQIVPTWYCPIVPGGWGWAPRGIKSGTNTISWCEGVIYQDEPVCPDGRCPGKPRPRGLGNPLLPEARIKYQREIDYTSANGLLQNARTYRSDVKRGFQRDMPTFFDYSYGGGARLPGCLIGKAQIYEFDAQGKYVVEPYCFPYVSVGVEDFQWTDGEGRQIGFVKQGNTYVTGDNQKVRAFRLTGSNNWVLVQEDNSYAVFAPGGRLLSEHRASGGVVTYSYVEAVPPRVTGPEYIALTDSFGRTARINYNSAGYIESFVDPAGGTVGYTYDRVSVCGRAGCPRLLSVRYQDNAERRYHWNEPDLAPDGGAGGDALTGITDELGIRVGWYAYDTTGRALSTQRGNGIDRYRISSVDGYGVNVEDPLGSIYRFGYTSIMGALKSAGITQPAGSGSAAGGTSRSFDAKGNLTQFTGLNGMRTCYDNDQSRNLETVMVEGLPGSSCSQMIVVNATLPAGSRKVSTQWHPDWRLATRVAEPGRITTSIYNGQPDPFNASAVASCAPSTALLPDGKPIAVLCKQVEQATTDADGHLGFSAALQTTVPARTQSWTYNQYGQVLSEDGPRTDVNDITTYTYYSDTTADHTMGDPQSVTDAVGRVTQYSKYNRHGQLLESTDPNGVVTTNTYDLRMRLLSTTVAGQTTSYSYDPVGQLKKVTLPDQSWVGYDYDGAHRQVAVYDHKGNRTEYVLDNAGNRKGENTKDPNGALKRQLSRSIDALGRVQQTTGRE